MADVQQKGADEMFCSSCGAIIKKEAEICPKCGVRLKSALNAEKITALAKNAIGGAKNAVGSTADFVQSARQKAAGGTGKMSRKKKIAGISLAVFVVLAALNFGIPKLFGGLTPRAKADIVVTNASEWVKLQRLYLLDNDKVGSKDDIGWGGYSDPYNLNDECKEKKCFSFYTTFTPGIPGVELFGVKGTMGKSTFCAKNNENIGSCKAGNEWCVVATDDGKIRAIEPEDKSCIALTPIFSKISHW